MIHPGLLPFIDIWNRKWARAAADASPRDRRELGEAIGREMRMPTPTAVDADAVHWVDTPANRVRLRVFRHRDGGSQPGLVYMHGGGWIQGSPETHWDITARIASWNRQTVLSVDYAKSPEHPFPAALEQCAAVVEWAFENASALGIDSTRIGVGGDSAGGNLAAAVALKSRGGPRRLQSQLLAYPPTAFVRNRPSYAENPDGPIIRVADMARIDAMYCPDPNDLQDPLAAPLLASDHSRLPPAYIAVAEHDPLRDDGIAYAEALRRAGVPVELDRGDGLIHGYLRAIGHCDACGAALERMCAWLARQQPVAPAPARRTS